MATKNSWAVSTSGGKVGVEDARFTLGGLWTPGASAVQSKTGFRPGPGTSPGLVAASGTPDANVSVAPFIAVIQSARGGAGSGAYVVGIDAAASINILSTPAHGSLNRRDLIVAQQSDEFYGDANSNLVVRHVVGTPAASPSDPAVSGSADYITLARVTVRAGTTSILGSDITDMRPTGLWTVAVGGILPVPSQAVRDALTGRYDGFAVYRTDREWVEVYDGAGWRVQGVPQVSSSADLSAITSPYAGQIAVITTTSGIDNVLYRYTGSAWARWYPTMPVGKMTAGAQSHTNAVSNTLNLNATSYVVGITADLANDRFTATVAGVYDVRGRINWAYDADGYRAAILLVNGSSVVRNTTDAAVAFTVDTAVEVSTQVSLAVGDHVSMQGLHTAGASLALSTSIPENNSLQIAMVCPL